MGLRVTSDEARDETYFFVILDEAGRRMAELSREEDARLFVAAVAVAEAARLHVSPPTKLGEDWSREQELLQALSVYRKSKERAGWSLEVAH